MGTAVGVKVALGCGVVAFVGAVVTVVAVADMVGVTGVAVAVSFVGLTLVCVFVSSVPTGYGLWETTGTLLPDGVLVAVCTGVASKPAGVAILSVPSFVGCVVIIPEGTVSPFGVSIADCSLSRVLLIVATVSPLKLSTLLRSPLPQADNTSINTKINGINFFMQLFYHSF